MFFKASLRMEALIETFNFSSTRILTRLPFYEDHLEYILTFIIPIFKAEANGWMRWVIEYFKYS